MSQRVVLVHGAWHGAWVWEPMIPALLARGLDPVTVDLPSAHGNGDLRDDVAVVRAVLHGHDEPTLKRATKVVELESGHSPSCRIPTLSPTSSPRPSLPTR